MKAIVYRAYGTPDNMQLENIPRPVPEANEVQVSIHATSINPWDWDLLRGKPIFIRMWGLFRPKHTIICSDVAGTVEAVGARVTTFQPGDHVYGDLSEHSWGGLAEYVCAPATSLRLKPSTMTFEEAASLPQAGLLALQGLVDAMEIKAGSRLLINGAGGGVGTLGIQIAKALGAEVTAVDSPDKFEMMRSVGADHVIDYRDKSLTPSGVKYDFILDAIAHRSMFEYMRALAPGGSYVMLGGKTIRMLQILPIWLWLKLFGSKRMVVHGLRANEGLDRLEELHAAGSLNVVIDSRYPLDDAVVAFRYFGEGRYKGKVVINVKPE